MDRKIFIINGDNFSDLDGFYNEVQKVLTNDFRGFGKNLDSFNDILRGGFGRFEYDEKIKLIWKNSNKSRVDLGFPETIKYLKQNFTVIHPTNIISVRKRLEQARQGEGPTLFDILVEIVKGNENVELLLS